MPAFSRGGIAINEKRKGRYFEVYYNNVGR